MIYYYSRASSTDYSSLFPVPKIDVLMIRGVSADYQSNPQYLNFFVNYQNTPPSILNKEDLSLYPIFGD
jgi:hypothetical protein